MDGIINVLKPTGMTSSDVVVFLRKLLGIKKVGHTGTLDPGAAGVLPICIGKATRLFDYIVEKDKEYIADLTLGYCTDTMDSFGKITYCNDVNVKRDDVERVLNQFKGKIVQKPPMFSAIKHKGKKLYELARDGQVVDVKKREVEIKSLSILQQNGKNQYQIFIKCSKGTYIRSLCNDIGMALGCGGYMSFLLRISSGPFYIRDSCTLDEISNYVVEGTIEKYILPLDFPLHYLPTVHVKNFYEKKLANGNPVPVDFAQLEQSSSGDIHELYRIYCNDRFYGLGSLKRISDQWYVSVHSLLI